jgi:8-oxo-dGTP pyrophosphatase MutT (NUDIX family)
MSVTAQETSRFGLEAFLARANEHLHAEVPVEGSDVSRPAPRSDDDLNAHLGATFECPTPCLAAVLVPVVRREPELTVLLTQRTEHMPSHPGQVAFPGGKIDRTDDGPIAAALRESHEETGLAPEFVEPLGFLDAYQTRTGFRVMPVVSLVRPGFTLVPEPGEVAHIFEVPLRFLMDPKNHQTHSRQWQGVERHFYAMPYGEHYIWGATAGMIRNLYDRLYTT